MAHLTVNLSALRSNLVRVVQFCEARNLDLLLVTKVVQSRGSILSALGEGTRRVADVHASNFEALDPQRHPVRAILRPTFGDATTVARLATRVFVSDPRLARVLGEAREALVPGHPLEVILMVETGDLRDGIPWDDLPGVVRSLAAVPGLDLRGLGTNLGCLAGAVPDQASLTRMADHLNSVRRQTGHPLPEFSLGGTVFWDVLEKGPIPPEFTELRIGEAVFFGWNTSLGGPVRGLSPSVFRIDLEVLEAWDKQVSAVPEGPVGYNAFGSMTTQSLTGRRKRAVLDGGGNLVPLAALTPLDPGCILVGETHEYTVVDCQDSTRAVEPGGFLRFRPGYEAVARSFLSPFLVWKQGEEE